LRSLRKRQISKNAYESSSASCCDDLLKGKWVLLMFSLKVLRHTDVLLLLISQQKAHEFCSNVTCSGVKMPCYDPNEIPPLLAKLQTVMYVGFEVLTVVVMKSIIFWDITPCSSLKVN
jgi:hypothetical protein